MSDITQLLPAEARNHFLNLRNMRDSREIAEYNEQLRGLKSSLAARGLLQSGHFLKQTSDLQKKRIDLTVRGWIEDALATCELYAIPLTREFCTSLVEVARSSLSAKYARGPYIQPLGFELPAGAANQLKQEWEHEKFSSLPSIQVLIETARVADERKRREAMANKPPEPSAVNYIQNVTQTGLGSSASQFGNTHTNILPASDFTGLKQELSEIRSALKAQPDSLEADEVLGSLASAEKAAQRSDEHGVKHALDAVGKGGWEMVKNVVPKVGSEMLVHYLKAHGLV